MSQNPLNSKSLEELNENEIRFIIDNDISGPDNRSNTPTIVPTTRLPGSAIESKIDLTETSINDLNETLQRRKIVIHTEKKMLCYIPISAGLAGRDPTANLTCAIAYHSRSAII